MTVRRVLVHLFEPTRDKDVEVVLLTNLPLDDADAVVVSDLYRKRWKIETAFGHMTLALNCEIKPLCYPKAALFCFASALMAYNCVRNHERCGRSGTRSPRKRDAVALLLGIGDMPKRPMECLWHCLSVVGKKWKTISTEDFAAEVRAIVSGIDLSRYRKSIRGPKKPPPKAHEQTKVRSRLNKTNPRQTPRKSDIESPGRQDFRRVLRIGRNS